MRLIFEVIMNSIENNKIKGNLSLAKNIAEITTGKENANFSNVNGKYKFFTCADNSLFCDQYSFDQSSVIISGNGNFGVKHYTGKFNAYQRTYILTPKKDQYAILYLSSLYSVNSLKRNSTGSIIKFITKNDIENIQVFIPDNAYYLNILNNLIFKQEQNNLEIESLIKLRDFLLPLLMNGQATIKD
ncbi:restriction endonuclease subunit S [Ureaplasma diversum]|uniref:restriction endonuclease subunit S n=1 Tax=Ureaplasma diversum TaxID=42094 RepID=UPI00056DE3B8|nr:restriction endonuclease subunit S [Ureaplasma diversum]